MITNQKCGHNGGQGIGAGHVCLCVREKGHPLDSDRPHGCSCMALWKDPEPVKPEREWRTAHWGTCSDENCLCSMIIYPHSDAPADLPEDEDEWDSSTFFISCPVCGSSMDWGGTDHPADLLRSY